MDFTEFQIPDRINADEKKIGVGRVERDEVPDVGFEAADFLSARIERMNQADLIPRERVVRIAGALGQCNRGYHAA